MRWFTAAAATIAGVVVIGCNSTPDAEPPQTQARQTQGSFFEPALAGSETRVIERSSQSAGSDPVRREPARTEVGRSQPARETAASHAGDSGFPDIPEGASWTIYAAAVEGTGHVERSKRMKEQLIRQTRMPDWYVIHQADAGRSVLYYGFYCSINERDGDARAARRARADRERIDRFADNMGNRPFAQAIFVDLDSPDPSAPREWNLENAEGFWSLQIATYKGTPDRKQLAVEAVREARQMGVEAYYYHGETMSHVLVGAWPENAIRRQEAGEATSRKPTQEVLVATGIPMEQQQSLKHAAEERDAALLQPVIEIVDPSMLAMRDEYPLHVENGEVIESKPRPSLIVKIPHRESTFFTEAEQVIVPRQPTRRDNPNFGRLRSLDDN